MAPGLGGMFVNAFPEVPSLDEIDWYALEAYLSGYVYS